MSLAPFQHLFDEHWSAVVRFAAASAGATHAEDLAQETMLAALRAYPRFDGRNPRGWLLTIARNKITDHRRANGRAPVPVAELPDLGSLDSAFDRVVDRAALAAAVGALSERQRSALLMRHLLDLSYPEIARGLECSEAAARRRVADGLAALRSELAPQTATKGGPR